MERAWLVRILPGCVLLAGCAEPESGSRAGFQIDTVGPVVRVWNAAPGQVDTLSADLSIGRMGGTGPAMPDEFGQVASATIDGRGEIFVADWQAREIRVFSNEGRFLRAFGRSGEGPGEFSTLYSPGWLGDTLRVVEREYTPVPVSDEPWEAGTAEYREFREQWPGARCDPAGMDRPSHQAPLQGIFFDQNGGLVTETTAAQGTRYDFYDAEGVARRSVLPPSRDTRVSPYFRGNRIVQVAVDSLGIQRVEVFTRPLQD